MDAEAGGCRGAIKAFVVVFRQANVAAMSANDSKRTSVGDGID
jgi:hypothetical protein